MAVRERRLWPYVPKTNDQWIHLVLNFIGPSGGQGIQAFRDGVLINHYKVGLVDTQTAGEGRVVVGRKFVTSNRDYAHVEVDELIFFNQALLAEGVMELYSMYW